MNNINRYIAIMALGISANNSLAGTLSTSPDWKKSQHLSANLSGVTLALTIPGQLSKDFPQEFPQDQNVYDANHYTRWPSFKLSEIYWDYKDRTLFWQNMYGTLKMRINIHKVPSPHEKDIFIADQFIDALDAVNRSMYDISTDSNSTESGLTLPEDYRPVTLKDKTTAIKFRIEGGTNHSSYIAYAIPLNESHFISAMFTVMVAHDKSEKDWYNICLKDIEAIAQSISLDYANKD